MESRRLGPFVLIRQIGIGGMGVVYLARHPAISKDVALKVLSPQWADDPKNVKRFKREGEIMRRLKHPNIVKFYGAGVEKSEHYYAMELLTGGSLEDVLKKRRVFPWEQIVNTGRQISSALEHSHNAGIVHRDLKPENVFMSVDGHLKLGDFGIAKDTERTALTAAGKTVGTVAYMAPEQIQGGKDSISGRTDLYALGCLLYKLAVGETPFQADGVIEMLQQHVHDAPHNVSEKRLDCPPELDQLIERLLEKDPHERPHDAGAVHLQLGMIREKMKRERSALIETTILDQVSTQATTSTVHGTKKRRKRKKRKKQKPDVPLHERTWFLTACLITLVIATWGYTHSRNSEDARQQRWRSSLEPGEDFNPNAALDEVNDYLANFTEAVHDDEARRLKRELPALILEKQLRRGGKYVYKNASPLKQKCIAAVEKEIHDGLVYITPWYRVSESFSAPVPAPLLANPLAAMHRWKTLSQIQRSASTVADAENKALLRLCENHHNHFRWRLIESADAYDYLRAFVQEAEATSGDDHDAAVAMWSYVVNEFSSEESNLFTRFCSYAKLRASGGEVSIPAKRDVTSRHDER